MKKLTLLPVLILTILCCAMTGCGDRQSNEQSGRQSNETLSVTIVNRSLQDVAEVYICPAGSDDWGETRIETTLFDGDMASVDLGSIPLEDGFNICFFGPDGTMLNDFSGEALYFNDRDYLVLLPPESDVPLDIVSAYSGSKYDKMINEYLSAPEAEQDPQSLVNIFDFVGCWKFDSQPYYLVIGDSYEWMAMNVYGDQIGPFAADTAEAEGGINLYHEDGSLMDTLYLGGEGYLVDSEGNTLTASEYIMLLPTADDDLNMQASFPGSLSGVQISYPVQMNAEEAQYLPYGLSFNALMEDGTDDYYSNISVSFQPISGYDDYLSRGLATATPYMQDILNRLLSAMTGDNVIKTIASDCKDYGTYYSIIGYVWLDGSIFPNGPSVPVRGTMEVRYFGPTGYVLVGMAIALENRIQNYFDICTNMLNSCTFGGDWSTAPKHVPSSPAASDSGDYGTPYYWYDEDGDVWYWNGYDNEFIGFGDSYYIEDGQYYESNDDSWDYYGDDYDWDYEYYDDYDPWSDPGDGDDAWSDPGDYYDDYDDGWGDYFD